MDLASQTFLHPALGIDFGQARIGIAATDDFGIMAHPVETIDVERTNPHRRIAELCRLRKIRQLVLGLPLRMDGSEGDAAARVRKFATELSSHLPEIPLCMVDESLTTQDAAEKLHRAGKSSRKQKPLIDQMAAVEILHRWLGWDDLG